MRGVSKDNEIIPPFQLFSLARKVDLLFNLDKAARETIIRIASEKAIKQHIFIHFLPTAIYNPELCLATTNEAIRKYQIDPNQIVFEVVETEKVEDYNHLNTILDYYKKRGYKTALDDVGSGFNNTKTIRKLKPDFIKIDQSIIRDIHMNDVNQQKLLEYLTLAKRSNIVTLAEGIETQEEYDYVKSQGIDLGQGYYLGRPQENT